MIGVAVSSSFLTKTVTLLLEKDFAKPIYVMRCAIWDHLYNFKNVKNTHGEVLILVKLQASVST